MDKCSNKCDCDCAKCKCGSEKPDTSAWTPELETMLLDWQEDAMGYIYIHQHSAKHYRFWHRICMFLSITLVGIGGIGSMFVEAYKVKWPVFVFAGLAIVGGILASIDEKFDLTAEATRHDEARKNFTSLPRKIQLELRKDKSHRKDADDFADSIEEQFATIQKEAPDPLEKHVRMWVELKAQYNVKRIDTYSQLQLYRNQMGATSSTHETRRAVRQQSFARSPSSQAPDPAKLEVIIEGEKRRETFTVDRLAENATSGSINPHRKGMFKVENTYRDILHRDAALLPNRLHNKVLVSDPEEVPHTDPIQYLKSVYTNELAV